MTSTLRERRGSGEKAATPTPSSSHLDLLDEFNSELERLSAMQKELLHELRSDGLIDLDAEEKHRLRAENDQLRARVAELERLLHEGASGQDLERQSEYEKLLDEKSEIIRALHLKLQALEQGPTQTVGEAVSASSLEALRADLEEQRRQLEEDEAAMMQQMRTMEMSLAKDRADLARLRTELQRQQTDLARDVEIASRDTDLHERLASLRRPEAPARNSNDTPVPAALPASKPKSSGLIRRLFG